MRPSASAEGEGNPWQEPGGRASNLSRAVVFSSYVFLFYFLPLALAVTYALARAPQRGRNLALVLLGYAFYGWANPKFDALMLGTTSVDWLLSLVIARNSWRPQWGPVDALTPGPRTRTQRAALVLSLVSNLGVLGFFKYFNFGAANADSLLAALGMESHALHTTLRVVLPLGISFYTFQSLSYVIDVYRGDAKAMRSFVDFACFVSMFPHLVAGPILKFSHLAGQIESRTLTLDKTARGAAFVALGLSKKVILANGCGKVADLAFNAGGVGTGDACWGALAYAFQIYFDFSGYSDMAIGLGLMLGFVFGRNFDSPYRSASLTEFWRRWHISLSTWLREYLYFPLGGSRKGAARTYFNLLLTMLLGGLWHGASWNFVLWGGLHGGLLAWERSPWGASLLRRLPRAVGRLGTFGWVVLAWVFFRASDLPSAFSYLRSLAGVGHPPAGSVLLSGILYQPYYVLCMTLAGIVVWACPDTWEWTQRLTGLKAAVCVLLMAVSLVLLMTQSYNPFIYFTF